MTESERLRQRAEELRGAAKVVESSPLLGLRNHVGAQPWQGPRAEQFTDELSQQERVLQTALQQIEAAIQRLATHADELEMYGRPL